MLRFKLIGQYQRSSSRKCVGQNCNATVTTAVGSYGTGFRLIGTQSHLDCHVSGPPLYFKTMVTKQSRAKAVSNSSLKTAAPWAGLNFKNIKPTASLALYRGQIILQLFSFPVITALK